MWFCVNNVCLMVSDRFAINPTNRAPMLRSIPLAKILNREDALLAHVGERERKEKRERALCE